MNHYDILKNFRLFSGVAKCCPTPNFRFKAVGEGTPLGFLRLELFAEFLRRPLLLSWNLATYLTIWRYFHRRRKLMENENTTRCNWMKLKRTNCAERIRARMGYGTNLMHIPSIPPATAEGTRISPRPSKSINALDQFAYPLSQSF